MVDDNRHQFWEEGFAEFIADKYLDQYGENHSRRVQESGKVDYIKGRSVTVTPPAFKGSSFQIPVEHLNVQADLRVNYSQSEIAALVVKSLCQRDPEFFSIMLKARHNIDALREFHKRLEVLCPEIHKLAATEEFSEEKGNFDELLFKYYELYEPEKIIKRPETKE